MSRDGEWERGGTAWSGQKGAPSVGLAPGKRTLTSRLAASGVSGAARGSRGHASPGMGGPAEAESPVRDTDTDTGKPLPAPLRGELERASRCDLGAVRLHVDAEAASAASGMSARAFALGPDVYFDQGAYDPGSRDGQRLIAHEVMHTQQHAPTSVPMAKRAMSWPVTGPFTQPGDDTESQADAFADAFAAGRMDDARAVAARPATMHGTVARSPRTAQAPAAAPEPAIRFRLGDEPPGGKRYVRRGVPARVLSISELITHLLVHTYGWPARHAQGPFDEYWIAWDPADSPGITAVELQRAAGVVTIAISEKLDEYLTSQAERMRQSGSNGPDRKGVSAIAEGAPHEAGQLGQDSRRGQPRVADTEPAERGSARDSVTSDGLQIPDRLKSVLQGEPASRAKSGSTWRTIIDELMAMSDEDLVYFRMLATHLTDEPERFLASIRLYKQLKADYLAKLEEALEEASNEQRPLERAAERAADEPPDPAKFKRWSPEQKREEARRRIEQASRAQLAEMVSNPKQTIKAMAKAALRPDEAVADVQRDLQAASKAEDGWAKTARGVSASSKFSGLIAGILAFVAVAALFVPGVNALFLIQSSFVFMMGSAVLSLVESELHVRAAGEAGSVEAFEEEIQLGAEAQTRGMVAVAGMATAVAGALIARIPLPGRLKSVGNVLSVARTAIARNIGEAWISVRAGAVAKLRQATAGLLELLDRESRVLTRAAAELDGMTADQFYQRIARDDAFRDALGMRKDMAETLAELAKTDHGRATAQRVFEELRASFRDAPRLAREQLQTVIDRIERAIADLEAADTPDDLAAALERAQSELSESSIASKMGERGAQQTADKLESLVGKDSAEGDVRALEPELADANAERRRSGESSEDGPHDASEEAGPKRTADAAKLKSELGDEVFGRLSETLEISQIAQLRDGFGADYLRHLVNGPRLSPRRLLRLLKKPGPASMRAISKRVQKLKSEGVRGDLSKVERDALLDQLGARGELDAMERWTAEGRDVEALPELQNAGKNPDYLVDKRVTEVKTTDGTPSKERFNKLLRKANEQFRERDGDRGATTGDLEIQFVEQKPSLTTFEHVERELLSEFRPDQFRGIDKVSVYWDGELIGVWERGVNGEIVNIKRGQVRK